VDKKHKACIKRNIAFFYHHNLRDHETALQKMEELNENGALDLEIAIIKFETGSINEAKRIIQSCLWNRSFTFYFAAGRLAECYEAEGNLDMALEAQKLHALFLSAFTWERPNYADHILSFSYYDAAKYCRKLNKNEEMWLHLAQAAFHAVRFDQNPSYKDADIKFMDGFDTYITNNSSVMSCHNLLNGLEKDFAEFSGDERYIKLMDELNNAKQTKAEAGVWG
jgi:hypothetical protein